MSRIRLFRALNWVLVATSKCHFNFPFVWAAFARLRSSGFNYLGKSRRFLFLTHSNLHHPDGVADALGGALLAFGTSAHGAYNATDRAVAEGVAMWGVRIVAILVGIAIGLLLDIALDAPWYISLPSVAVGYLVARYVGWAVGERRRFKLEMNQSIEKVRRGEPLN